MSSFVVFFIAFISALTVAQFPSVAITDIGKWPNWADQRFCVQCVLTCYDIGIEVKISCGDWLCVCDHYDIARPIVLSVAISYCSSNVQDVASATSIFDAFCSQLPGVATFTPVPTVTAVTTSSIVGVIATVTTPTTSTVTPSCNTPSNLIRTNYVCQWWYFRPSRRSLLRMRTLGS